MNSENIKCPPNSVLGQKINNPNIKAIRGASVEKIIINQNQRCKSNENFNNGLSYKAPNYQDNCYKYLHK